MERSGDGRLCGPLALSLLMFVSAGAGAQVGQDAALGVHKLTTQTYKAGDFKKAAELYHTAFKINPQPAFLFNAARSEQRIMLLDEAEKHFEQVLTLVGLDDRTRSRTKMHLQEIATVRKALASAQAKAAAAKKPEVKQTPKPVVKPTPKPEVKPAPKPVKAPVAEGPVKAAQPPVTVTTGQGAWQGTAGWASLGTGVVLAGIGGWLLISYMGDQTALDQKQETLDGAGKVADISFEEYEEEQQSLWTRRGLGAGAVGIGLAAVGVGAWMLATAPEDKPVVIAPSAGGATLAWRF